LPTDYVIFCHVPVTELCVPFEGFGGGNGVLATDIRVVPLQIPGKDIAFQILP